MTTTQTTPKHRSRRVAWWWLPIVALVGVGGTAVVLRDRPHATTSTFVQEGPIKVCQQGKLICLSDYPMAVDGNPDAPDGKFSYYLNRLNPDTLPSEVKEGATLTLLHLPGERPASLIRAENN